MSKLRGPRRVRVPLVVVVLAIMTGVLGLVSGAAAAGHTYDVRHLREPPVPKAGPLRYLVSDGRQLCSRRVCNHVTR